MSVYPMQELIRLWRLGKLTDLQLVGQLLAYAYQLLERQSMAQAQIATLREELRMLRVSQTGKGLGMR